MLTSSLYSFDFAGTLALSMWSEFDLCMFYVSPSWIFISSGLMGHITNFGWGFHPAWDSKKGCFGSELDLVNVILLQLLAKV